MILKSCKVLVVTIDNSMADFITPTEYLRNICCVDIFLLLVKTSLTMDHHDIMSASHFQLYR